jgi:GNAT superfamily N-acetyltransferase
MTSEIREESLTDLEAYARIPISFEASTVLELLSRNGGLGGFELLERPLCPRLVKDYDAIPGNHPTAWPGRFDLSNWGFLSATLDSERIGGAAVAFRTPGMVMLEDREDLAVLWDLRIAPQARQRGLGAKLFGAASEWATTRGCRWLKIETQNINVPACRFYASQGCVLGSLHRFAYPDLPDEIQLIWYKKLGAGRPTSR